MKNDYEIRGELTAIIINSPKYGRKEVLISTRKLDRAIEFPNSWHIIPSKSANTFYVQGNVPRKRGAAVLLHRWLTNAPDGMQVDHRNHDGLINTDDNLRICTNAENQQNQKGAMRNSKSGVRGVCWYKRNRKWRAQICIKGRDIFIGDFDEIIDAEKAVKEARAKYMPYAN